MHNIHPADKVLTQNTILHQCLFASEHHYPMTDVQASYVLYLLFSDLRNGEVLGIAHLKPEEP